MHQPLAATESKVSTGCREGLVHCAFGFMHPTRYQLNRRAELRQQPGVVPPGR